MQIRASSWIVRTLLWAAALGITWYFMGHIYDRFLGSFVHQFLPSGTFLLLKSQVFLIGLDHPSTFDGPILEIPAHNFGFGLVVTGAVVLGTQGPSWALRAMALAGGWLLLFLTHASVLVWGSKAYYADLRDDSVPLVTFLYLQGLHPIVIVLPLLMVVIWLLLPPRRTPGLSRYTSRRYRRARTVRSV